MLTSIAWVAAIWRTVRIRSTWDFAPPAKVGSVMRRFDPEAASTEQAEPMMVLFNTYVNTTAERRKGAFSDTPPRSVFMRWLEETRRTMPNVNILFGTKSPTTLWSQQTIFASIEDNAAR